MNVAALIVAVLALLASGVSVRYAHRSALAAQVSADAALADDLRAREPRLAVSPHGEAGPQTNQMFYTLRNDGPQDLDSITLHRPITSDGITYWVRRPPHEYADAIELGPLPITAEARFGLSIGTNDDRPDFRVRIDCVHGHDRWTITRQLDVPPSASTFVW